MLTCLNLKTIFLKIYVNMFKFEDNIFKNLRSLKSKFEDNIFKNLY